jgi:hypothetical protein
MGIGVGGHGMKNELERKDETEWIKCFCFTFNFHKRNKIMTCRFFSYSSLPHHQLQRHVIQMRGD